MTRNECEHGQLRRSCQICDLVEERDEWKAQAEGEAIVAGSYRDERDALAAHVERLKAAWSEADSNGEESVLDDVFGHWLNGDDYDALAEAFDEAPLTSLAALKAQWQAEALDELMPAICDVADRAEIRSMRDKLRRQAGGDV